MGHDGAEQGFIGEQTATTAAVPRSRFGPKHAFRLRRSLFSAARLWARRTGLQK